MTITIWRMLSNALARKWADAQGSHSSFLGTADTFYLDGSAHRFEARLQTLGAEPHVTYLPDRTHFDLYRVDQDRDSLLNQIGAEMYAVGRPGAHWKAQPEH